MSQRFQGRQIIGIPLQNVTKCLARFFIISKSTIRLGAAPGSLDGIRVEDQSRVECVIGAGIDDELNGLTFPLLPGNSQICSVGSRFAAPRPESNRRFHLSGSGLKP